MNIDFVAAENQIKTDGNFLFQEDSWGIIGEDGFYLVEQAPSKEDAISEYFEGNLEAFLDKPE